MALNTVKYSSSFSSLKTVEISWCTALLVKTYTSLADCFLVINTEQKKKKREQSGQGGHLVVRGLLVQSMVPTLAITDKLP